VTMENADLIVSIMPADAVIRQNLAWNDLLDWLRDLQSSVNMFDDVARRVIYEELFSDREEVPESSVMTDIERVLWKKTGLKRIDLFMETDILLWNDARRSMKDFFINALIPDVEIQKEFGLRFGMNYVRMANLLLLYDVFPELSLLHLSLEFFRSPSLSNHLVTETPMFQIICKFLVFILSLYIISASVFCERYHK
jgi:hypothetical protein